MTNEDRPRIGGDAAQAARQENWLLKGKNLSRRVPRFAAFVEAPEGKKGALTDSQGKFLDEFSSELTEALSGTRD